MKPTAQDHNYPKFLVKENRANLLSSILEIFKSGYILSRNFDNFQVVLVQVNKAVYAIPLHDLWPQMAK